MQPARIPSATPPAAGGGPLLDQEFGAASLSGLRAAVLQSAAAAGLDNDRAIDVMLAMHELAANAVRHGAGRGRLMMDVTPRGLRCQVSDSAGRPAGESMVGTSLGETGVSWPVEHGHGLWIVRRTADQVQMTTGPDGSDVFVIFTLPAR